MKSAFVVSYFAGFLMFQVLGNSVYTVDKHYSQLVVDHFLQKKLHRSIPMGCITFGPGKHGQNGDRLTC